MINVDHVLKKGNIHNVCEDSILSGFYKENHPYIILSDGCSSSQYTDVGSKILTHILKKELLENHDLIWTPKFISSSIIKADIVRYQLGLQENCLDATVMIACLHGDRIFINCYGDGLIFVKNRHSRDIIKIEYQKNMPFYPSYLLNPIRESNYSKTVESKTVEYRYPDHGSENLDEYLPINPFRTSFLIDYIEFIAISSDGISSFQNKFNGEPLDELSVLENFTSFKNTKGGFVQRRVNRAIKNYEKEGISHYDDLSFGVIHMGDNDENKD